MGGGRGSTASQRTNGELAPDDAAGKVPVPLGRDASGRPRGLGFNASSEAFCGALAKRLGPVAAAQACREHSLRVPTERGSLSSCLLQINFESHLLSGASSYCRRLQWTSASATNCRV